MALINCPECNKEISNEAVNCTHCGFPVSQDKVTILQPSNDTDFPEFPLNITVGSQLTNWFGDTVLDGEIIKLLQPNNKLSLGKISVGLCKYGVEIRYRYKSLMAIHYSQIIKLYKQSEYSTILKIDFWDTTIKKQNLISIRGDASKVNKIIKRFEVESQKEYNSINHIKTFQPKTSNTSKFDFLGYGIVIVIAAIIISVIWFLFFKPSSKDDLIKDAQRKEMNAQRQKSNFYKDGDIDHLYGAAEYYRDAISLWEEAIDAEDDDYSFDEDTRSHIGYLMSQITDIYKY